MKSLIDVKKHQNKMYQLINASAALQEGGVTCYFENASMSIALSQSRVEIILALDKDIKKSAAHLSDILPIINSIKNNIVTELSETTFNYVEDVFGNTYDKRKNSVTLCGVEFFVDEQLSVSKGVIASAIYAELFGIDKKKLNATLKAIGKYEEETDPVKKAILYPATIMADEIIALVTKQEIKYSDYRSQMSFEDKVLFDVTFKRTGIEGVIQNSTYIDCSGIKQILPCHNGRAAKEIEFLMTAGRLKYIEALEVDGDGDIDKALRVIEQIERLKINSKVKFTLKFRKLGGYKARGLFMCSQLIVAEDVRDTSALLHEIGHLVHMTNLMENDFVNNMITRLTPRIDFENTPEGFLEALTDKKMSYYADEKEVVARAIEIASLFAQEQGRLISGCDELELIKSRRYYEEYEGIYFDFTKFSEDEKEDMLKLFKLFYETSPDEVVSTEIDNFYKIDTKYTRVEKEELSINEILKVAARKMTKETKALYSMVNAVNIQTIVENKGDVSIYVLASTIFANISHCGNHNVRMSAPDWAEVIESKAGVVMYLLAELRLSLSKEGYIEYLMELIRTNQWSKIRSSVLLSGFKYKFAKLVREELVELPSEQFDSLTLFSTTMKTSPIILADREMLENKDFMFEILDKSSRAIKYIMYEETGISIDLLREYNLYVIDKDSTGISMIHDRMHNDIEFMDYAVAKDIRFMAMAGAIYRNNAISMNKAFKEGVSFHYIGVELNDDEKFVTPFIKENPKLLEYLSPRLQKDPYILSLFDNDLRELELLKDASTSVRRKTARTTTSQEVIEFLAKDRLYEIRAEIAKRNICPVAILESLSKLKSDWIQAALAGNCNTPKKILLSMLRNSEDYFVLQNLAKNSAMDTKQLKQMSQHKNRGVQWNVICNKRISHAIMSVEKRTEIVKRCMLNNEEHFYYMMKSDDDLNPNIRFLEDFSKNTKDYLNGEGFEDAYRKLTTEMLDFKKKIDAEINDTPIESVTETVEDKVMKVDFDLEKLIESGELSEFEDTVTGEMLTVVKTKERLSKDNFKLFAKYIKVNNIGYYSKRTGGYVITKQEVLDSFTVATSASIVYSAEALQSFANGTLF